MTLINGIPCDTISVNDRGLLYGDGVFRTMLLRHGTVVQWQRHYAKLAHDCSAIDLHCPSESTFNEELASLVEHTQEGVIKVLVTRGSGQRGYAPALNQASTRILSLFPQPDCPVEFFQYGVRLRLCQTRLGHQPRLAGIKHLNRLENVLAAAEWNDPDIAEGLLLDESGFVVEGVRSNVFLVKDGILITPDLSRCGVAGIQRDRVIEWGARQRMACKIAEITLDSLLCADEIFLVNSIIGLWPVRDFLSYHREYHPVSRTLQNWLSHEVH